MADILSGTGSTPDLTFEHQGAIAIVTLDRPKALNALTLEMIRTLDRQIAIWASDDEVKAVVIRGALTRAFFREEYVLNRRIHTLAKPWIALLDGITMGGGVGLSVPGSHRIVTDKTLFSMPEAGIGLFPDVGGSWYLPRCPGQIGTYLALTGTRLHGADVLYAGLATHYVPSGRVDELVSVLSGADWSGDAHAVVDSALARFAHDPGTLYLATYRDAIDRCFQFDSVEEIFASLEDEGTDWAIDTLKNLRQMSPTSLKVTLRQMRTGRTLSFDDAMTMEYRMSQAFIQGEDFYEGVRALLVDRDKSPRWRPDTLDAVSLDLVETFFTPLGERDLTFSSS